MIKMIWRFALLVAVAIVFAWLADRPGSVTIRWLGREIEMSVVVAVAAALLLIIALLFVWNMLRQLWRSPRAAREFWRFRKARKGYEALSKGMIAASAGDAQGAARHAAAAGNALSDEPLVNLLAAQAAQLKGDRSEVKRLFDAMAKSPDTEILGLRGLFAEARQTGDLVAALKYAEKALSLNPRLPWASSAVLQVQTARKDWAAAALTVAQQGRAGLTPRAEADRKRAALLAAEALKLEDQDKTQALKLALEAHDIDVALVPATLCAARLQISAGQSRKAMRLLKATWAKQPHPEIAMLMARAYPEDSAEERFERVRDAIGDPTTSVEHAVALAEAALAAKRVDAARSALSAFSVDRPQARVCALMAQIEDAAGDKGRTREWLARAIHAPRDPMWVSDGVASHKWVPLSPVTGDIVPSEWKVPYDVPEGLSPLLSGETPPPTAAPALPASEKSRPLESAALSRLPDDPGVEP